MNSPNKPRIETLDWLRGLMALSIMFYHLTYWTIEPQTASTILGRLGIYAVSIFFILSGLSMAIVYNKYINSIKSSINFLIRRLFRIWPLLGVVTSIMVLVQLILQGKIDLYLYFINVTTIFGFIAPDQNIAAGAWSIGNEMVYYSMTPLIIVAYNYKRWIGNSILIISIFIGLFFAFHLINSEQSLRDYWTVYVNPFNNLFLYILGISIYYNLKDFHINFSLNITILAISVLLFCFLPFNGDRMVLVSGFGRIIFVTLSFLIVLCFYKLEIKLPAFLSNVLESFGIATYGVYLIHPLVYSIIKNILEIFNNSGVIILYILVSVLTIFLSIISYKYFELPLMKVGKKLT